MITLRKSTDRGHANLDWLDSWHTFSFASYQDPRFVNSSSLRVINQDIVKSGSGFPPHAHDNMEILTYVLRGAISHRDSMGNEARVAAGEFQLMSAGTGVTHSEYNRDADTLELLQIWLFPNQRNTEPGYQQKHFADKEGLQLIASAEGHDGSLHIRQNTSIWRGQLRAGMEIDYSLAGSTVWLQQIKGEIALNDEILLPGDGAEVTLVKSLSLRAHSDSEFIVFDLP
jgi:redox-sensitive bicupin YhaK (pirin superfamily)